MAYQRIVFSGGRFGLQPNWPPNSTNAKWGPPRGKRDGVIRHILERENVNWMIKIALLRE